MVGKLKVIKMTVIKFPRNVNVPLEYAPPLPRQRVFYLGIVYTGPAMCQEVTRLYLKRHRKKMELENGHLLHMKNMMSMINENILLN